MFDINWRKIMELKIGLKVNNGDKEKWVAVVNFNKEIVYLADSYGELYITPIHIFKDYIIDMNLNNITYENNFQHPSMQLSEKAFRLLAR